MRIGLEIDGVIADICAGAVKAFGTPARDAAYSLEEMFVNVPDNLFDDWRTRDTTYLHLPVVAGALDGIAELAKLHNVYLITSRPSYLKNVTARWLRDNGITIQTIHTLDKDACITRLALDRYVDTDPTTINALDIDGYLFTQPYNVSRAVFGERVLDWNDLLMRLSHD